jgi:Ca-activated chloride channel homolog
VVAELVALVVGVLALGAESLHARRVQHVAELSFGPTARPNVWARGAPAARIACLAALAWGLVTLMYVKPKIYRAEELDKDKLRHLLIALDVSPSMRLQDGGPTAKQARIERAGDVLDSFLKRSPDPYRISVVAFYNGAKPVVVDTVDMEVIKNIFGDLPMNYAFEVGQTRLFDGLEEAAKVARPWQPKSATLMVMTDGDTVPATGMPKLPASISHVLVVGVGDPRAGSFIDGRQSRQDASTLRQVAVRLHGVYHNANEKQISTDLVNTVSQRVESSEFERLTRREYALLACAVGALVYGLLPLLLSLFGTPWRPGVRTVAVRRDSTNSAEEFDTQLTGPLT